MIDQKYIPDRGDIIWVNFNPVLGHEQAGYRPALVLSSAIINSRNFLAIVCPVTSKDKKYPFHINLDKNKTKGFIMTDQIKSIDLQNRKIKFIEKINSDTYQVVVSRVMALINL